MTINIDRITEYAGTYVLIVQRVTSGVEDDLYEWHIERSDGLHMRCLEQSPYWLSLPSTLEEGRAALAGHVSYDVWLAEQTTKRPVWTREA